MKRYFLYILIILLAASCSKYLDEKPDEKLSTINSIEDCQALLDRRVYVNGRGVGALEAAADNYYFNMDFWLYLEQEQKNLYTWHPEDNFPDFGFMGNDWSFCYDNVFRANAILEALEAYKDKSAEYNNIKGQAHFLRANNLLQAAWTWALAYNKGTAKQALGLPLRLTTNFNTVVNRSTVEETYKQIIADTRAAIEYLPDAPKHVYRSSKTSALALLSRVYLSMNEYDSVYKYSSLCLNLKSDLLNYNNSMEADLPANFPFRNFNKEILFEFLITEALVNRSLCYINTELIEEYAVDDLRKTAFFQYENGHYRYKGSYSDNGTFCGLTTAEVLLMKAESASRLNLLDVGLESINRLRAHRMAEASFTPLQITNQQELVDTILSHRRKELVMRALRFMDVKRLNELGYGISLKRTVNGTDYTLPAKDNRFALPIPDDIIANSEMKQNPR